MKLSLLIALVISAAFCSCNDENASKTDSKSGQLSQSDLSGKWKHEKIEKYAEGTSPEDASARDERSKGLTIVFSSNGQYYSVKETGAVTDTVESGRYEILNNDARLVTFRTSAIDGDTVKIVKLTATTLKVETPVKEIVVLKKVN